VIIFSVTTIITGIRHLNKTCIILVADLNLFHELGSERLADWDAHCSKLTTEQCSTRIIIIIIILITIIAVTTTTMTTTTLPFKQMQTTHKHTTENTTLPAIVRTSTYTKLDLKILKMYLHSKK